MQKKNQWKDQSTEELKALHRDLSKEIFDLKSELACVTERRRESD